MTTPRRRHLILFCLAFLLSSRGEIGAPLRASEISQLESLAFFQDRVLPILKTHCYNCHSSQAKSLKGGLSLEFRSGWQRGGESGEPSVVPRKPDESPLVRAVRHDGLEMPPGKKLSDEAIADLVRWVELGAPDPREGEPDEATRDQSWWSLQPLVRPELPAPAGLPPEWVHKPIDRFVGARLAAEGFAPAPAADRRTLIRRLAFDLLGLPPTPEEVTAFAADPSVDAYERLVDRLLESERYGERWARHWLDVVHYGETHGYDKDQPRLNAWPYRDYVIRAFNQDKPFARFVQEQIAGDVLFPGTRDGFEALGFISAGPWDLIGHAEVPETKIDGKVARHLDRDDMVSNTINTFCSVTVHCAQCHNHKFDPVPQEDYYALQAVFAALDRADRKYDLDPEVATQRARWESQERELSVERTRIADAIAEAGGKPLKDLEQRIADAHKAAQNTRSPEYGWHSAIAARQEETKWVQVDLGQPLPIEKIVVAPCWDDFNGIGAGFGYPVRFRIEACDRAEFQTEVRLIADHTTADVANPGTRLQEFPVGGVPVRFVRITATKLAPRANDYIFSLAELQAVDGQGVNVALGAAVAALDSIEAPVRWGRKNLTDGIYPEKRPSAEQLADLRRDREALIARVVPAEIRQQSDALEARLAEVRGKLSQLPPPRVVYSGTIHTGSGAFQGTGASGGKPRPITVLKRGDVTKPGNPISPGALSCVAGVPARFELPAEAAEGARRAALAQWLTSPDNPLPWRSIVNRVWQYHFGRGLVDTPNDFGRMGALPSHPELLDWLASEFRDQGGSLKQLHRRIVLSETYKQRSDWVNPQAAARDADNRLLWRMNRRKLEAEAIRDSVLAVAGKLDLTMGGPSFQDFVIEHPAHSPHYQYHLADPENPALHRRSVYRFIVRSQQQPWMATMDCADPSLLVDKRNESISPLQALAQLNNGLMVVMARHFARRVEPAGEVPQQIEQAFHVALQRAPQAAEREAFEAYARQHGMANACRLILNLNEFVFVD